MLYYDYEVNKMLIENLKKYRKRSGLSQKETAKLLNMSQQGYAKYETGTATPDPERLAKIAKKFKLQYGRSYRRN